MLISHEVPGIAPPFSSYTHAVEARQADRWLCISGQVGVDANASLAGDSRAQMHQCWRNIFAVLETAGMDRASLVKVTAFLTDPADTPVYREVRDEVFNGHLAASTLLIVNGLAHPHWKVEIEAIAAA